MKVETTEEILKRLLNNTRYFDIALEIHHLQTKIVNLENDVSFKLALEEIISLKLRIENIQEELITLKESKCR